jgi:hypothetical protein
MLQIATLPSIQSRSGHDSTILPTIRLCPSWFPIKGRPCFVDDPIGIDCVPAQERRLLSEVVVAVGAIVYAHRDMQQHWVLQMQIDRQPLDRSEALRRSLTDVTGCNRHAIVDFLDLADSLINGQIRLDHDSTSYSDSVGCTIMRKLTKSVKSYDACQ